MSQAASFLQYLARYKIAMADFSILSPLKMRPPSSLCYEIMPLAQSDDMESLQKSMDIEQVPTRILAVPSSFLADLAFEAALLDADIKFWEENPVQRREDQTYEEEQDARADAIICMVRMLYSILDSASPPLLRVDYDKILEMIEPSWQVVVRYAEGRKLCTEPKVDVREEFEPEEMERIVRMWLCKVRYG